MKLKNRELYEAHDALQTLVRMQLPVRTSFRIAKLAVAVERAQAAVEVVRLKILETGVVRDDAGVPLPVHGDDGAVMEGKVRLTAEGGEQLRDLMDEESEVDVEPLELELLEGRELEPRVLIGLGALLK